MSLVRLLLSNLLYHWRGNLAVLLGVMVGATVLTGALLVGDSLQGSLRAQSERRLGWVDHALVAPRFYRQALAAEVAESADARVTPSLLLQGTCAAGQKTQRRQLRGVTILGVEDLFFDGSPPTKFGSPGLVWVNRPVAEALGVQAGATMTLRLQKPGDLPREAGLGKKDVTFEDWELTVAAVLDDGDFAARFSLRPELTAPRNVVVSLPHLQERLDLPGQVNAMLAAGQTPALTKALGERLTLDDWGLSLLTPESRAKALIARYDIDRDGKLAYSEWISTRQKGKDRPKYAWVIEDNVKPANRRIRTEADLRAAFERMSAPVTLQSKQLLISQPIAEVALKAAKDLGLHAEPALVYLCRFDAEGKRVAGVVAAVDPASSNKKPLTDDEIILLDEGWTSPRPAIGSRVTLRFKPPESHGPAADLTASFTLAGYVAPEGKAADPTLTPDFPGITDKDDLGAWDLPFEDADWKKNINTEYGDAYWKRFRGTPKAYITLARGKKLWGSRFGDLTSIRLSGPSIDAEVYRKRLLADLKPSTGGFVFDPTRASAMEASQGGTPFGLLFLGFSVFLIASALLLVGLLYRLNLDRRSREVGVLFAEGFTRRTVGLLLLGEGGILAVVGVVLGSVLALAYSRLLVDLLAALWPGGTLQSFLRPYASPQSLLMGGGGALLVSLLTIWWVVRGLAKTAPRALLLGQTTDETSITQRPTTWRSRSIILVSAVLGVMLLAVGPFVPGQEAQAGTFFGSGALFLTAGLVGLLVWMKRSRQATVEGHGLGTIGRLGVRNAARNATRSLLTVGLLASAAFLIVAVESFRRRVPASDGTPAAADGGFALVGESDLPLFRDPNTDAGRAELLTGLKAWLAEQGVVGADQEAELTKARGLLQGTTIVALRARAGDDASCLNLYKPRSPRVLGVPQSLIDRGGFVFDAKKAADADETSNPWRILGRAGGDVPAFGEKNTVTWMLRSGLGKSVMVPDDHGVEVSLVINGLLHDSVFQSSLLVSEERFLGLYPGHAGYNYFLIQPPEGRADEVKLLLERALADRGLEVTATAERLAAYLSVENTYLTTFQALGGLGLVLGSLGLAVVLLRAIWERRAELALLQALGYRRLTIGWLVLSENSFLLAVGLVIGAASALLSILPQLLGGQGSVPWANLALLFAGVLVVALTAGSVAVMTTMRTPIVPALRRE